MPAPTTRLLTRGRRHWTCCAHIRVRTNRSPIRRPLSRSCISWSVVGTRSLGMWVWAVLQHLPVATSTTSSWSSCRGRSAALNAYLGYRLVVFESPGPYPHGAPALLSCALRDAHPNLALLPIALNVLPLNIYVIQAFFTAAVVVVSYLGTSTSSFRRGRRRGAGGPCTCDPPSDGGW